MHVTLRTPCTALALCAGLVLTTAPAAGAATAGAPAVRAAATSSTSASTSTSTLQVGSRGPQVREWQALLNRIFRAGAVEGRTVVEDGVFGPATDRATRTVQAHLRLAQDGVVGPLTRRAVSQLGFATGVGGTTPGDDDGRRLLLGSTGADVREWQRLVDLAIDLGRFDHARLAQDGVFGPQTRSATVALQRQLRVTADGVVGPVTREATGWLLEG